MALKLDCLEGDGGDYPLVRMFGRDPQAIAAIIDVIDGLTVEVSQPVQLPGVEIGQANWTFGVVLSKGPTALRRLAGGRGFVWSIAEEDRAQIIGLLEPFLVSEAHDRFQWLCEPQAGARASDDRINFVLTTSELGRW